MIQIYYACKNLLLHLIYLTKITSICFIYSWEPTYTNLCHQTRNWMLSWLTIPCLLVNFLVNNVWENLFLFGKNWYFVTTMNSTHCNLAMSPIMQMNLETEHHYISVPLYIWSTTCMPCWFLNHFFDVGFFSWTPVLNIVAAPLRVKQVNLHTWVQIP